MFYASIGYNDGTDEEKTFKSIASACLYIQNRRGVVSVLIEKDSEASGQDLEDEFASLVS